MLRELADLTGFGALKYAAKYYGHFASVSSHSGPASLRRDFGLVVHWANLTSAVLDLGGGTVYGAPIWDQARVSADNPVERIDSYRNKRIFLVAGTSPDPLNWFDSVTETQVLASGSSANASATPASRMNRMRCPAATSSGPTCSSSTSTASSPGCAPRAAGPQENSPIAANVAGWANLAPALSNSATGQISAPMSARPRGSRGGGSDTCE